WRSVIKERVRRQWRSTRAYLRWYVQQFQKEHPELSPPKQAVLLIRIYRTPEPGQPKVWSGPVEQPLARWLLDASPRPGVLPIEVFDPVERRFVTLTEKD